MSVADKIYQTRRKEYLWSDNYWIDDEDEKVWFLSGRLDILFCIDKRKAVIAPVAEMPNVGGILFRQHPRCMKYHDKIYCLPDMGEDIYRYSLNRYDWKKIPVSNPDSSRIAMYDFWIVDNLLYIVSNGLKKIIILDMEKEEIVGDYHIVTDNYNDKIVKSIKVGKYIYSISAIIPQVYKFDCEKKRIIIIDIPEIDDKLQTISFDGDNFWLSGHCKKIYIWNEMSDEVKILDDFPIGFGIYDFNNNQNELLDCKSKQYNSPAFITSFFAGRYMWFIPFRTNKILYVDKGTLEINTYYIEDEIRTTQDFKVAVLDHMYLFEYIDDRYFGIYSLKTEKIVEIDYLNLRDKIIEYSFDRKCDEVILNNFMIDGNIFYESDKIILNDLMNYTLSYKKNEQEKVFSKVGRNIYSIVS